jgi:hypothetical protein
MATHLRFPLALALAVLSLPAAAATLRCVSVNGNVTCSGTGGTSCQTVDGHTVCTTGNGAAVQSFGSARGPRMDDGTATGEDPDDAAAAVPRAGTGRGILLQRDGTSLHLRNGSTVVDID